MFIKGIMSQLSLQRQDIYKPGHLLPVMTVENLLKSGRHQALLRQVETFSGLSDTDFHRLYRESIYRFTAFCQAFPLDIDAPLCSLLHEGLATATVALRQYAEGEASAFSTQKAFAIFTAGLYRQLSHVVMNQRVLCMSPEGEYIADWQYFRGPMTADNDCHYLMLPLAPVHQRLDHSLSQLLARQVIAPDGLQWIAEDLYLLADWLDAIIGTTRHGGVVANILAHLKRDDILALQQSLAQANLQQVLPDQLAHGVAFYQWLRRELVEGRTVNAADSGIHMTADGVFLERDVLFSTFCERTKAPVNNTVVFAQFGNLMGIAKKGGGDFLNAQFFSTTANDQPQGTMSARLGARSNSIRHGMVVKDAATLIHNDVMPAVSAAIKRHVAHKPEQTVAASATPSSPKNTPPGTSGK